MDIAKTLATSAGLNALENVKRPQPEDAAADSFLKGAETFLGILSKGEETARNAMTGTADPHALVEALASSQMAVETVVTVRDRVVEAYQEILRMPI